MAIEQIHNEARTAIDSIRGAVEEIQNKLSPILYAVNDLIIKKPQDGVITQEEIEADLVAKTELLNSITETINSITIE